jgi:two-component system sensor histidine kinase/response regulator
VDDTVYILLVDDNASNLEVLEALLNRPGVRLLKASRGEAALELLLRHEVALALIDVRMPDMDGFELAELMRGTERTRRVPIIFVTASPPEPGRIFRGYEAGAVDFLFKPLDTRLLQSKVEVFIELSRQRYQLAVQVEEYKKLSQTAELMIGVLSHDLRAPLSAIMTGGELLQRAYPDDPRVNQISGRIRSSSVRMTRLVEQLLDFATARLGRLPLRPQPTNLGDLCHAAVTEFEPQRPMLRCHVSGDPKGTWDPDRLQQVLSNLIGNAVQHGDPTAPITVRIDGGVGPNIQIRVENGGTIPDEIRDSLFSPFVRADGSSGGAGLGLYIVDQIARAHGGSVSVETIEGGTAFVVNLPRHASSVGDLAKSL